VHIYWLFLIVRYAGPLLSTNITGWLALTIVIVALSFATAKAANATLPRYSRYLIGYSGA